MQNITENMIVLSREGGDLSVTEFIIGQRFYIHNSEEGIKISQDEKYNKKTFGKLLDANSIWESLQKVYNIDERNMSMAPVQDYTLHCIYYDRDLMAGMPQMYPDKGVLIVEVELSDNRLVPQTRTSEFCSNIGIPCIEPIFVGDCDSLKEKIRVVRMETRLSQNKIGGGVVVKNEPANFINGKFNRWYIEPNVEKSLVENNQNPEAMAKELVETMLNVETIFELEKKTNVSPTKKIAFKNVMLNYLKGELGHAYIDYMEKSGMPAIIKSSDKKFEKIVRSELTVYLNDFILNLEAYKNRKA